MLIFDARGKPGKEPTTNPTHQRRRRDLNLGGWEASAAATEPPVLPLHLPLPSSVLIIVSSQSVQSTNCLSSYSKRTQQLSTLLGQQCWSCCIRVGSGEQTDATTKHVTSNNVASVPWGFTKHNSLTSTGDISSILPIRSVKNSVMSFCSPVFSGCLSIVYVRQNVFGL